MSVLNYSKWDNIEISDDEDDTHPNIHTPSLFKWRHEARVQRMQELEVEKERVSEGKKETEAALKRAKTAGHTTEDLEKQLKDWKLKVNMFHRLYIIVNGPQVLNTLWRSPMYELSFQEKELDKKEKEQPLNVDTIGQEAWRLVSLRF